MGVDATKMQPPAVRAHCCNPPQTVLYSVDDSSYDPLVSTHTMKVGVGVGVGVEVGVGVGVSRADWSFKQIAPDTARR